MKTGTATPSATDRWDIFLQPPVDRVWYCSMAILAIAMVSFICCVAGFLATVLLDDSILSAGVAVGVFLTAAVLPPSIALVAMRRDVLTTLALVTTSAAALALWSIVRNTVG